MLFLLLWWHGNSESATTKDFFCHSSSMDHQVLTDRILFFSIDDFQARVKPLFSLKLSANSWCWRIQHIAYLSVLLQIRPLIYSHQPCWRPKLTPMQFFAFMQWCFQLIKCLKIWRNVRSFGKFLKSKYTMIKSGSSFLVRPPKEWICLEYRLRRNYLTIK